MRFAAINDRGFGRAAFTPLENAALRIGIQDCGLDPFSLRYNGNAGSERALSAAAFLSGECDNMHWPPPVARLIGKESRG
jgi:hypothetical protein